MKYTVIFVILAGLYWIWQFVSAVVERGLPTHPVYYVFAVIGVILGFLTYRLAKSNVTKRRYVIMLVSLIVLAIVFCYTGVAILQYIGSGLFFWYMLSFLGFYGYFMIRKWSSKKKLTEAEENLEHASKGFSIAMIFLIIILMPALLIIFLLIFFFSK